MSAVGTVIAQVHQENEAHSAATNQGATSVPLSAGEILIDVDGRKFDVLQSAKFLAKRDELAGCHGNLTDAVDEEPITFNCHVVLLPLDPRFPIIGRLRVTRESRHSDPNSNRWAIRRQPKPPNQRRDDD